MAITVGRSSECDLQVFHESVSRIHFRMEVSPYGIMIEDCGSSGGTWVDGRKINKAIVQPGDEVKLANLITLDWENPVIREFLLKVEGERKLRTPAKKSGSKTWAKAVIPIAAAAVVLSVLFATGVLSVPGGSVASRSATLSSGRESVIGVNEIKATIPAGASNASVTIEVNPVEMGEDYSTEGVHFASDVYSFTDPGVVFDRPITIELAFDPSVVPQGSMPFPAYLKDTMWVQVSGQLEDSVFIIESNHLSTWAVLYDDVLRWQRSSNPLIASLHQACEAVFTIEEDKWEMVRDDWETIESNSEFYLGTLPEAFEGMFCDGDEPSDDDYLTTVHASGNTNEVYFTNLPAYISAGNYSSSSEQIAAWCFHGEEWISIPETVFKCLYTVKCREALENMDREQVASELEEAADDLSRMHFWHAAGSGIDMLQTMLSEVLAHGTTGVPPSPFELVDMRTLHAIEGIICRAEMERLREELLQLASDLRSWEEEGHYTFDTPIISRLENAYTKIDAVAELSRATFPAFEENWFSYTASKVLTDFMTLFIQREAAHFAQASAQAVDFQSALYSARLSSLLSIASDAQTAEGLFNIICHAINASGDNPLYNYYMAINRPDYEIVDSFTTLVETAYVVSMLEQVEDDRFTVAANGVITDTVTGLEWIVYTDDPGWRPTWQGYDYWADNLGNGWSLPGIAELTELYNAGISSDNWGCFQSDVNSIWSSQVNTSCEDVPSSSALFLDFSTGRMNGYDITLAATGIGGFAVRDPNQIPVQSSSAILFYDGFENDRVGSLPGNWSIRYSGNTLQAVDSPVYAGNRAFMLRGNPSWVGSVTHSISLNRDFSLEAWFYLPSGGLGRETQGSIGYNDGYRVQFIRNGYNTFQLKLSGDNSRYGSYSCDEWHRIELQVDTDSQRYRVLLDGSVVVTKSCGNLDDRGIELWSCNLHDSGAQRTVYFDEVKVAEGNYSY